MYILLETLGLNAVLWIAIFSWFIAQLIKVIVGLVKRKKIDLHLFISSGGMPSSHTSFVCAMSTAIGIIEGFETTIFAVAAVLSMIIMYDASGVRRAAGRQAKVINLIVEKIENPNIKLDQKLKELLGHTPTEVFAGALLGILVAIIFTP